MCSVPPAPVDEWASIGALFDGFGRLRGGCFRLREAVFELFEDRARIIGRFLKRVKNTISHLNGGLKSGLFAAVLAIREVFGKLIPLAAYAQAPALKGSGFVCIAGDVSLGHVSIVFCGLVRHRYMIPAANTLPYVSVLRNLTR